MYCFTEQVCYLVGPILPCRSVLIDTATLAVGAPDIPDGWENEAQSMHYGGLLQRSFVPGCRQICPPTLLNFYRQHERVRCNKLSALSMPSQDVCCNSIRSHRNRQHLTTWYIPWFSQWQAVRFFWLPSPNLQANLHSEQARTPHARNLLYAHMEETVRHWDTRQVTSCIVDYIVRLASWCGTNTFATILAYHHIVAYLLDYRL